MKAASDSDRLRCRRDRSLAPRAARVNRARPERGAQCSRVKTIVPSVTAGVEAESGISVQSIAFFLSSG